MVGIRLFFWRDAEKKERMEREEEEKGRREEKEPDGKGERDKRLKSVVDAPTIRIARDRQSRSREAANEPGAWSLLEGVCSQQTDEIDGLLALLLALD